MSAEAPLPSAATTEPIQDVEGTEALPKLSAADFKLYNKMAVMMEYYHNRFRQTWRTLYTACETNTRPKSMTLTQFMDMGLHLCQHLEGHHNIEEYHIFPILGRRMTEFSQDKTTSDPRARLMLLQHKQIHAGLGRLETYLSECKAGKRDFKLSGEGSLKEVMDTFGGVLWEHLDEEVRLLGAENMRRYWSKADMNAFNF